MSELGLTVDARGLVPPEPLVKILGALQTLPRGHCLVALTDRNPMHLHELLDDRGFNGKTEKAEDGSYITYIHAR